MMKPSSWRKPVPPFIPSPPTSPTLGAGRPEVDPGRQELDVSPEQLAPQWHDATTETRNIHHHHHMQDDQTRSGHFVIGNPMDARQLPRIASPVYLGSTFGTQQARKHRLYRPPTPPRSNSHKFPRLHRSDTNPETFLTKHVEIPGRRPEGPYAWSVTTGESCPRNASSIWQHTPDWRLVDLPNSSSGQHSEATWWEKVKALGVWMRNMMRAMGQCGAT